MRRRKRPVRVVDPPRVRLSSDELFEAVMSQGRGERACVHCQRGLSPRTSSVAAALKNELHTRYGVRFVLGEDA